MSARPGIGVDNSGDLVFVQGDVEANDIVNVNRVMSGVLKTPKKINLLLRLTEPRDASRTPKQRSRCVET